MTDALPSISDLIVELFAVRDDYSKLSEIQQIDDAAAAETTRQRVTTINFAIDRLSQLRVQASVENFERTLPFSRTELSRLWNKLDDAGRADGLREIVGEGWRLARFERIAGRVLEEGP